MVGSGGCEPLNVALDVDRHHFVQREAFGFTPGKKAICGPAVILERVLIFNVGEEHKRIVQRCHARRMDGEARKR